MRHVPREKAELYARYRLSYADEAVKALNDRTGSWQAVADVGAGTGLLTRQLAEFSELVYAIEPDGEMRRMAVKAFQDDSRVRVVDGTAETTTLDDASVDLITAAMAYNRFEPDSTVKEFQRILKPGGWLAFVSYGFQETKPIQDLVRAVSPLPGWRPPEVRRVHDRPPEFFFGQGNVLTESYASEVEENWDAFSGASRGGIESLDFDHPSYPQYLEILREVFDRHAREGQLTLTYQTRVLFGQPVYSR